MNKNQQTETTSKTELDDRRADAKKPPSDFLQGLVLFIAFIIFMAVWLHFNLPE